VAGQYDFIVLGSGPSGKRAAIQAAKLGKSVLVVEGRRRVGGVSVHTGTIPSKTLRETALNLSGWRERGFYGRSYRVKKEIGSQDLGVRLMKTLEHEVDVLEHQFLRNGVHTMEGFARFRDPHHLVVTSPDGSELLVRGERILIAVGTVPFRPENVAFEEVEIMDSDEVVHIPYLPRSLTVVGAGVIGIEYASMFAALGTKVTVVERRAERSATYCSTLPASSPASGTHSLSALRRTGISSRRGSSPNMQPASSPSTCRPRIAGQSKTRFPRL